MPSLYCVAKYNYYSQKNKEASLDNIKHKPTFSLIVQGHHLYTKSPEYDRVEVRRIYPHTGWVGSHQLKFTMRKRVVVKENQPK